MLKVEVKALERKTSPSIPKARIPSGRELRANSHYRGKRSSSNSDKFVYGRRTSWCAAGV